MNEKYAALKAMSACWVTCLVTRFETQYGEELLAKVETIRKLSKTARAGSDEDRNALIEEIKSLPDDQLTPVVEHSANF